MENAFISMCYIHKGQTKFTNRVRKRCKYYLDGVGIKVSLQEACSLTRAVSAFQKHAMRRHSGVQRSLPSGRCIGQKAGCKLARWTWRINHRYSVCTCDCIWISGIHANVVEQYIMFVTWCYVTLYYIILYIILYYILSLIRIFMRGPRYTAEFQQDEYAWSFRVEQMYAWR